MTAISNAQAEDCQPVPFLKPSQLVLGPTDSMQKVDGHKFDNAEYPNIEWEDVPDNLWSFDETTKDAPFPLGYRRAQLNYNLGGVMCLKIPKNYAQHKVEVSVESLNRGTICISDTRKGQMNMEAPSLVTACDENGQVTTCFSTLTSGALGVSAENGTKTPAQLAASGQGAMGRLTSSNPDVYVLDDAGDVMVVNLNGTGPLVKKVTDGTQTVPEYATEEFAVAIGCKGNGCTEGSDSLLFYRVRASKVTWTKSQNNAESNLDMWCMMMAQRNPALEGTTVDAVAGAVTDFAPGANIEDTMDDKKMNMIPQMYPTDLWAPKNINPSEDDPAGAAGMAPNKNPGMETANGAVTVAASIFAVALPLLALLF